MKGILAAMSLVLATALAFASAVEARGRCDGVHGCTCGVTAARNAGVAVNYNGYNLKQAVQWTRAFPRTSAAPGTVLYQRTGGPTGHVAVVTAVLDQCTVTVKDERGQYDRDICRRHTTFVDPHGGSFAQATYELSGKRTRRARQASSVVASFDLRSAY